MTQTKIQLPIFTPVYKPEQQLLPQPACMLIMLKNKKCLLYDTQNAQEQWQTFQKQLRIDHADQGKPPYLFGYGPAQGKTAIPMVFYTNTPTLTHNQFLANLDPNCIQFLLNIMPQPSATTNINKITFHYLYEAAFTHKSWQVAHLTQGFVPRTGQLSYEIECEGVTASFKSSNCAKLLAGLFCRTLSDPSNRRSKFPKGYCPLNQTKVWCATT